MLSKLGSSGVEREDKAKGDPRKTEEGDHTQVALEITKGPLAF